MSVKLALDSYAWVEYASGSQIGEFVDFLLNHAECITPSIVIAELSDKFHREERIGEWQVLYKYIKHKTTIITLDGDLADLSGGCKKWLRDSQKAREKKAGLADAIIYQTALLKGCKLVTGDEHFEAVADVVYLKSTIMTKQIQAEMLKSTGHLQ